MTTETPLMFRLNNGREVLAKMYEGEPYPVTYANRTQAERKAAELGAGWAVFRFMGRPFYVAPTESKWGKRMKL
jgi:hypothetical protein